jgi:hypothetical protein
MIRREIEAAINAETKEMAKLCANLNILCVVPKMISLHLD